MKSTFKADKLGRISPTDLVRINNLTSKRLSLRPKKSMTRSKSVRPLIKTVLEEEKTE